MIETEVHMPKVYLSPSLQPWNMTALGVSEQYLMGQIADAMEPMLQKYGITYNRNRIGMTLSQVIAESNTGHYDLHVAIHSNASLTAGSENGSHHYYFHTSEKGRRFADLLVSNFRKIYPECSKVEVRADSELAELRSVRATSAICEVAFHDNMQDARWIHNSVNEIANAITNSIIQFFNSVPAEVTTDGSNLNIREGPGLNFPIIDSISHESTLSILSEENGFYHINFGGREGFASHEFISPTVEVFKFNVDGKDKFGMNIT